MYIYILNVSIQDKEDEVAQQNEEMRERAEIRQRWNVSPLVNVITISSKQHNKQQQNYYNVEVSFDTVEC